MSDFGLSQFTVHEIKKAFEQHKDIKEAILFGSRAMGNFKPGSDVDLALIGDITPQLLLAIKTKLNQEIPVPYHFDIVNFSNVSNQDLIQHIKKYGKLFYRAM